MNEKVGVVFSIAKDNAPVTGCTISKAVHSGANDIIYFSLAKDTDISAEIYPYHKLLVVADGTMEVYGTEGFRKKLEVNDCILTPTNTPVGMRTSEGAVYTEISIRTPAEQSEQGALHQTASEAEQRRKVIMNGAIKAGEVFKLADLIPYQEGRIVNMDVVHNDKMKFVVMAFDEGTGLSEHAAPGEAIIFALDGEGVIGYEGKEHPIQSGENFNFAKGGLHSVKATKKFKMALLLTLE